MIVVAVLVGVAFIAWRRARAHRRSELAGLSSEKPTFSIAPPLRALVQRKEHHW